MFLSQIPVFDNHVNQLEYRDPFAKVKPFRSLDESESIPKRNEDSRPKTSHGKRKEKKDSQKNRQLSPKSKQQGGSSSPRSHLGALEPMKPLQPIIPSHGIQSPRSIGGNHGNFPGSSFGRYNQGRCFTIIKSNSHAFVVIWVVSIVSRKVIELPWFFTVQ